MPERLEPLDYKGVSRSKGAKSWADDPDAAAWKKGDRNESSDPGISKTKPSRQVLLSDGYVVREGLERSSEAPLEIARAATEFKRTTLTHGHGPAFAGLFLFTFIVFMRPYEFFPSLAWASSSALVVALITLLVYVPTQLGLDGNLTIRPREINLALILLVAGLLSMPLALERLKAWNSFFDYLKVILMFIIMTNVLRTQKRLRLLFLLVLVVSCVFSASALQAFLSGQLALKGERIEGAVGGMFENPNDLALHLVTMIPIAVALLLDAGSLVKKVIFGAAIVLIVAGMVVTFSRGGFLGLASVALVLAWRLSRQNKLVIAVLVPILLVGFVFVASSNFGGRSATSSEGSTLARQDDLKRSLFIASRHPLFGVGMDNYVLYSNSNHATHNAYTQVAAELGTPALIVYLMFLITPLKQLRRIGRETSERRGTSQFYYIAIGLEASLIGFMVSSFFASVAFLWYVYYLVAYAICLRRIYEAETPGKTDVVEESAGKNRVFAV